MEKSKVKIFVITFVCMPLLTLGLYRLFPVFEAWQTKTAGFGEEIICRGYLLSRLNEAFGRLFHDLHC